MKDFTADAIKDSAVLQMAQKVIPKADDKLSTAFIEPAVVGIKMNDGRVLTKRVDFPYGSPQNPVSWETLASKFMDCASYAAKPIPKENLEKALKMIERLEELDDVSLIIRLLS